MLAHVVSSSVLRWLWQKEDGAEARAADRGVMQQQKPPYKVKDDSHLFSCESQTFLWVPPSWFELASKFRKSHCGSEINNADELKMIANKRYFGEI